MLGIGPDANPMTKNLKKSILQAQR
jgi:hypothetical protein